MRRTARCCSGAATFDFDENPGLDSSAGPAGRTRDAAPSQQLQTVAAAAAMVDSFLTMPPSHRREFTHMYHAPQPGGPHLDRVPLLVAACPFIARAGIYTASPSDHRLALLHPAPRNQPLT